MINLYTVASSPMFPYARVFFGSLYKNTDVSKINKIFVLDSGLTKEQAAWLKDRYSKIEFIDTEERIISRRHKDQAWGKIVSLKTSTLREAFHSNKDFPYLMIDLDCFFIKDFYEELNLDKNFDVGICHRQKNQPIGRAGFGCGPRSENEFKKLIEYNPNHTKSFHMDRASGAFTGGCKYIGSFFLANNKKPEATLNFLDSWINEMAAGGGNLKESPALCRMVAGYKAGWVTKDHWKPERFTGADIKEFEEKDFSCYVGFSESTKIVHFKSFGGRWPFSLKDAYKRRFNRIAGFNGYETVKEFVDEEYLERHASSSDFSIVE